MKNDVFSLRENAEADDDPPYMVIKTKDDRQNNNFNRSDLPSSQQTSSIPGQGDVFGMGLQLGEDYEKKKQKLQQELRLDYRTYVSKKTDLKSYHPLKQPETLSLLFDERKSVKDKLRDERKKEYNLFLKEQAALKSVVSKRQSIIRSKSSQSDHNVDASSRSAATSPVLVPDHQQADDGFHDDQPPSARRDRPTPTEEEDAVAMHPGRRRRRRRWEAGRAARETPAMAAPRGGSYERRRPAGRSRRQRRRRRMGRRSHVGYSSEEEEEEEPTSTDEEEEMEHGGKGYDREGVRAFGGAWQWEGRRKESRADRRVRNKEKASSPAATVNQDTRSRGILKPQSATSNINRADTIGMRSAERARSAAHRPQVAVATGLAIGAVEGSEASQMKKELYRLELLEQMAEQQRNKRREKELELRVAATGAVDPEKKPGRIAQFGAADPRYDPRGRGRPQGDQKTTPVAEVAAEHTPPPGKPRVAFSVPGLGPAPAELYGSGGAAVPQLPPSTEEFHRSVSNTLGEMAAPRLAGLPPPVPPTLAHTYRTPYDEAYLYYGARHPLDPNVPYYYPPVGGGGGGGGGGEGGGYQPVVAPSTLQGAPPQGPPPHPGASSQQAAVSPGVLGVLPEERPGQTRESALSYGEALRQQIKESKACRTREREERERYHAKLEEEMKAYEPWGRGGAGAPIRDKGGNLISDLNKMRRTNENAYTNPEGGDRTEADEGGAHSQSPHQIPGVSPARPPHFARSKVFPEEPTPRKLLEQKDYRHFLELQMEEKRRRQVEEQEAARLEEERLERRMVEEQARMQREFLQEQENKRRERMEQSRRNGELMLQAEERRKRAERRRAEEEEEEERQRERESTALSRRERERQESVARRGPSPLIPTLQRRLGRQPTAGTTPTPTHSQPSSAAQSDRCTPAPYSPPVPARRNELRAKGGTAPPEERQEVIRELSALRRHLSAERRRVELLARREETPTPPPHPARYRRAPEADLSEAVRAAGRVRSGGARVTMQNIRDFNRLRDRDTVSRAEVRYVYPDPPSDDVSLDIQQQALLRMQQRRAGRTPPGRGDGLTDPPRLPQARQAKPRPETEALLASDSTFLDCGSADDPSPPQNPRTPPPSGGPPGGRTPPVSGEPSQKTPPPLSADRSSQGNPPRGRTASLSEERDRGGSSNPPPRSAAHLPPRRTVSQDEIAGRREGEDSGGDRSGAASSLASLNMRRIQARNQQRLRLLDHVGLDPDLSSEAMSGGDRSSTPLTARSGVSMETVATEPWLRPGTSEAVKRLVRGETEANGGVGGTRDRDWLDRPANYHG